MKDIEILLNIKDYNVLYVEDDPFNLFNKIQLLTLNRILGIIWVVNTES